MPRDRKRRIGRSRSAPDPDVRPPVSLDHAAPEHARAFEADGEAWLAWVAGHGAGGTGHTGPGMVVAVHFARAEQRERPMFEALVPQHRFEGLYDVELRALLAAARAIPNDVSGAPPPAGRTDPLEGS